MRFREMTVVRVLGVLAVGLFMGITGCAQYAAPGRGVNLESVAAGLTKEQQTDSSVQSALDRKPLASFPTGIAVARIQAPYYRSLTAEGWGHGNYSIVTTRDIEKPEQVERLAKLPLVRGIAPLNRLVVPVELKSDQELRHAAARLHADMVLIYTLDTTFYVKDMAKPVTIVTLGLSPNKRARVLTTASAVLMDTRNGYIYGVAEATDQRNELASAWSSDRKVDETRLKTEAAAFEKLVGELEKMWGGVIREHAGAYPTSRAAPQARN